MIAPRVRGSLFSTMRPFRSHLFTHQDGVALAMILRAFQRHGALDTIFDGGAFTAGEMSARTGAAPGYFNIALRCLASQGWLRAEGVWGSPELRLEVTEPGRLAREAFPLYVNVAQFVRTHIPLERFLEGKESMDGAFASLVDLAERDWDVLAADRPSLTLEVLENSVEHLDGCLVVPLMTALKQLARLEGEELEPTADEALFRSVVRFLRHLGWIEPSGVRWTERGRVACRYALHYGLMGSYLPMMSNLGALLFEGARQATHGGGEGEEHVDRKLNVLASGAAHESYFADADALFRDVFDREPVAEQPRFVADMGCGDGTWLAHVYDVVKTTRRGACLDEHPLLMVGIDYNEAALDVARPRLEAAGVPHELFQGDIGDPDELGEKLAAMDIAMEDGLHIRSFIDHNRRYRPPTHAEPEPFAPTGAYVDSEGRPIEAASLEQDLVEHLARWTPYVARHGLVVFESHTVEPRIASRHIGRLHSIAFDTYHGFSNQYCVEFEVFMRAAAKAGLEASAYEQLRYPSRLPFVAISLNRFFVKNAGDPLAPVLAFSSSDGARAGAESSAADWRPESDLDLADGDALHRFLYTDGDLHQPRRWAIGTTGVLLRVVLRTLFERIDEIRAGHRPPILRMVDYGAGSGFATIELIKAGRRAGLFDAIEAEGIDFGLWLMDLPSSWLAKGHELLAGQSFTHFRSIRDPATGAFRPLDEIFEAGTADIVLASMVFHLIPERVMPGLAGELAGLLAADGVLVWNTPDTGPPTRGARLFHEPNRRVRQAALAVIDNELLFRDILGRVPDSELQKYVDLEEKLEDVRATLTDEKRAAAAAMANRQILPVPSNLGALEAALREHLDGETFTKTFEMRMQDTIDAILIPSNQKYLAEIDDFDTRARLSEMLMQHYVLPTIYAGPAATTYGFNLHWTFGVHHPRSSNGGTPQRGRDRG